MVSVPQWLEVIGYALGLGVVHVMTGPDHLSALSTLSVGKSYKIAFGLGVRWGCGHSFGLLVVAIIFFAVGQTKVDLDIIDYYADLLVGIFMIVLGIYYIIKPCRERMKEKSDFEQKENRETEPLLNVNTATNHDEKAAVTSNDNHECIAGKQSEAMEDGIYDNDNDSDNDSDADKEGYAASEHSSVPPSWNSLSSSNKSLSQTPTKGDLLVVDDANELNDEQSTRSKWMTRLVAFVAGTFHGVAGPGGVLGVMIALKLNDWLLSSLYLLSFFVSSIITMGIFAIIYGFCTKRIAVCSNNQKKCAFVLEILSALFSFSVGVLWLALLFTGKLDEWFD